ncbi:protein of unknown function [Shewanella benthica]|uniref:Uncharacterized protein n=1 Tax=Shewanella benthica TaxID=43661 RepID=A0A330M0L3_9GAMM|nr:protein of unknown function [Shewanella benthica]
MVNAYRSSVMPKWLQLWGLFAIFFVLAWYGVTRRLKSAVDETS